MKHQFQSWIGGLMLGAVALSTPVALHAQTTDPIDGPRFEPTGTPKASLGKLTERLADEAAEFARREQACEAGDVAACGDLGEAYELGIGTPQNRPIASILYAEACDAGSGRDCARLGSLTLVENREDKKQAAFVAFQRGCDLGSLDACAYLAQAYQDEEGYAPNAPTGIALASETCERGGGMACLDLANAIYYSDPDRIRLTETNALLLKACNLGEARGCSALVENITYYIPGPEIPPKADLLQRGCDLEDSLSCERLGDMTFAPYGTGRETALQYYDRACYLEPMSCVLAEDVRNEAELYQACQSDDNSACLKLAELYNMTRSPLKDPALAKAYAEYACYAGETGACGMAGSMVLDERPNLSPERSLQALAYLEKGCAADQMYACWQLAEIYERGEIVESDKTRVIELKVRMCDNGWFKECERLERAYASDPDVPLIEAGARYLPPIEEGDVDWQEPFLTDDEREALRTRCATSEIEFRGQVYTDTVCVPQDRVIGGKALAPGAAPWQALIWRPSRGFEQDLSAQDRVLCGGSHIAPGWILTAAHCLRDDDGWITRRGYTVRLGVSNPREDEGVAYPITRVYEHPDYNPQTYAYDIGLIRYDTGSPRNGDVNYGVTQIATDRKSMTERPIRRGDSVYVYGWGWTTEDEDEGVSTTQLRSAKLLLESQAKCNSILTDFDRSQWNSMLCAAGANGANACKGDSGGPLITYSDGKPVVIGVVSSGRACGQVGEASRYVRVAAARSWIDGVMGIRR